MSADMSCALEGDGHRCLNCEAYRAGRAAGYADAVADVVAEIRRRAGLLSLRRRAIVPELMRLVKDLEDTDGANVGAAKKGGDS